MVKRDPEFLKRLLATFRIEAEDHLRALSAGLIELEKALPGERHAEIVETIFREAHSLKGAARAVNQAEIERVCQSMEEIFAGMKRREVTLSPGMMDFLHQAIDGASLALSLEEGTAAAARSRLTALVRRLRNLPKEETPTPPAPAAEAQPVERPTTPEGTLPEELLPPDDAEPRPDLSPASTNPPEERATLTAMTSTTAMTETIRISAARMDALLLAAEELISARQAASRRAAELLEIERSLAAWHRQWAKARSVLRPSIRARANGNGHDEERNNGHNGRGRTGGDAATLLEFVEWNRSFVESVAERVAAVSRAAEQDSHTLRGRVDMLLRDMKQVLMQPFSSLLELLPKLVRDLAHDQAKEVEAVITGAEIEVERRILQEIKDPLIHLVRNCIDHGLEKPQERIAQGKPGRGTVRVAVAQREDGKVELLVADDGAGIDVGKVRAAALNLRVISADNAATMNDAALYALVFHSGLSTSPIITDLSGRGLGLTIVREKVEKLGGTVALETTPGIGTTFRIVLPTTVATMRGVVVRVHEQHFVFPATYVERVARVQRETIQTVENRETIRLHEIMRRATGGKPDAGAAGRDEVISLVWLGQVLQIPGGDSGSAGPGSFAASDSRAENLHLVLASADGRRMAFVVDEIIGEQEVLVKSLGPQLARVRNIAGATVMGTGRVVPILHVSDLLKSAILTLSGPGSQQGVDAAESDAEGPNAAGSPARAMSILVVEDSITARMQLQSILELAGYDVQTAMDGMDGMLALRGRKFDLVVSDVEMPRLNGFDLTAKIRADSRLADLPVVLVTALDSVQDRERGIDVGADAYIVKSDFDQSNLLDVIHRLIVVSHGTAR